MKDTKAIDTVRAYLKRHFPNYDIVDCDDLGRHAQTFRLTRAQDVSLLTVSDEFLEDHDATRIALLLEQFELAALLGQSQGARVIVTTSGVRVER